MNNTQIGLIISTFAIARLASGLISGKLVERFGERLVLGVGLFMVSFFTFFVGLATSYEQLLLFRAAGGLGSSMFSVSAGSLLLRSVSDLQRGRAQSIYNGGFLLGGIAGPAVGGILIAISPRIPFFIYSITLICAGLTSLIFLHERQLGKKITVTENETALKLRDALKIGPYRSALVLTFIASWAIFGIRSSILPLFVTEQLGAKASFLGFGFTLAALTQGLMLWRAGRVADLQGRRLALLIGTTSVFLGILILSFATHPWMFLVAMIVTGFGGAFLGSAPAAIVGDVIKGGSGRVIAFWQMAGDAGMMVGPILLGFISDIASYRAAFITTAAVFSISILLAITLPETRNTKSSSPVKSEELL